MKVGHFNTGSFELSGGNHKIDELRSLLSGCPFDVFGVSETWNKSHVTNNAFAIRGYKVHRNDRFARRGGGVCIFFKKGIRTKVLAKSVHGAETEFLFVRAIIGMETVLFAVVYRAADAESILNLSDDVLNIIARFNSTVIMGDFNHNLAGRNDSSIIDFWRSAGLNLVHNSMYTHFNTTHGTSSLIDYFATNMTSIKYHMISFAFLASAIIIYIVVDLPSSTSVEPREYYDFKSINEYSLAIIGLLWDFSSIYDDPNLMLCSFNHILRVKFDQVVPKRIFRGNSCGIQDSINTPDISRARILANLAFKTYSRYRTDENWCCYCRYRNNLKSMIRASKRQFCLRYFSLDQSSKSLWKKIERIGAKSSNSEVSLPDFDSEQFCDYFSDLVTGVPSGRVDQNIEESQTHFVFAQFRHGK